jgi:hypothetical protein
MSTERKRPWYLVLALLGALALGTTGAYKGWEQVALYHAALDPSAVGEGIADEHDRALVVARTEAVIRSLDAAKSRGWPLAVATLLIGGATLLFAMRALGGSSGARAALVQLVLAQAAVGVAGHWLLRDVIEADLRWREAMRGAEEHAGGLTPVQPPLSTMAVLRAASTMILVLRTLGSALVVIGLTRRGSREYFDATAPAVEER